METLSTLLVFCGEFIRLWWIPLTKGQQCEALKHIEQKVELPVTWDAMTLIVYHCNVGRCVHVLGDVARRGNMYREQ